MAKNDTYTLKSPLIWAGSKSWVSDLIWRYYYQASKERNENLRIVDPFCGSLAILFHILPEKVWANDQNPYLINFYKQIIADPTMPEFSAEDNTKDGYLKKRDRFNEKIRNNEINDREMAELFYYLNRAGYGGISRYNSKGEFNIPFRGKINSPKCEFKLEADAIRSWQFSSIDYMEVLKTITSNKDNNDFIFIDPPYHDVFNKYTKKEFNWDDQVCLAEKLAKMPNPVVAMNTSGDEIVELYRDLGFEVSFKSRSNSLQKPKVVNGKDFKEAIFTRNIK